MITVHKYTLELTDAQPIEVPHEYEVSLFSPLHVAEQNGKLCLWAKVWTDPCIAQRQATIYVRRTGHPVPNDPDAQYVGTVLMSDGLVWHVWCSV